MRPGIEKVRDVFSGTLNGKRVLIVQVRAMGDCILATPLIRAVKQKFPDSTIDFLSEKISARLLEGNPYISNRLVIDSNISSSVNYIKLLMKLRRNNYDCSIDLLSTPGSALLCRLVNAKLRIGYNIRFRSWAFNHSVKRSDKLVYNPRSKFDLVEKFGLFPDELYTELHLSNQSLEKADAQFKRLNKLKNKPIIALAPWSKREWRRWKIEHWKELLQVISQKYDCGFFLICTKEEFQFVSDLTSLDDVKVWWINESDIRVVAALISRCKVFIGMDNGLKHIAVALGIPSFTVYTGSDPDVWNPPDDNRFMALDLRNSNDHSHAAGEVLNYLRELKLMVDETSLVKKEIDSE